MVCGGAAETLIAYVPPADAELAAACAGLREARDAGRRAWFVTVPPADDPDGRSPGASSTARWTRPAL